MAYTGETLIFYKGYDNKKILQIIEGGVPITGLAAVTKVKLLFRGKWYDSVEYADAFDWLSMAAQGKIIMQLGNIADIDAGKDNKAELILYDPQHADGQVVGEIPIKVIELTGV
jgi:hypothetical protein